MGIKSFAMRSTLSPFYGETLAAAPAWSTLLDFSKRRHTGGLVCFFGFG
jgi:hypothetical protein